jgi:dolichol-phosphate mannosyltransferase
VTLVSIVVPAYNEQATLELFYAQLTAALAPLEARTDFELLFINNGSSDDTLALLTRLRERDPRIQIVTLSRNFGYQAALTAGLELARGDAVACIDSDGEDPPAVLARFVETWLAGGADIVYGVRGRRPESQWMQAARKVYYRVTRAVADHEIILDMAEFALLDRRVRDAVLATRSTFPFVRGQVGYVGFRRVGIPYDRLARLGGQSHYNVVGAVKFGLGGILSSSTFALRLLAYGAAALLPFGLVAVALLVAQMWRDGIAATAFAGIVGLTLLTWLVFGVGVLGIYLARVYKDQVGLPLYVIDHTRSVLENRDEHRALRQR